MGLGWEALYEVTTQKYLLATTETVVVAEVG